MSGNSIWSRPPKIPPAQSLVAGIVFLSSGLIVQEGPFAGGMIGGGAAALLMSCWDFGRLRLSSWWRARTDRASRIDTAQDR